MSNFKREAPKRGQNKPSRIQEMKTAKSGHFLKDRDNFKPRNNPDTKGVTASGNQP